MAKRTAALGTRAFVPSGVEGAAVAGVVLQDGSRAFTADQSMGGNQLTNVGDGSATGDAVNYGHGRFEHESQRGRACHPQRGGVT